MGIRGCLGGLGGKEEVEEDMEGRQDGRWEMAGELRSAPSLAGAEYQVE